jgi:hypothetical protein
MSLPLHARKKLELIVDRPHVPRFTKVLEERDLGYTLFPALGGSGSRGGWHDGGLTDADERVMIVAVLGGSTAGAVLQEVNDLFVDFPGIAFLSDVAVLRPDRFK